MVHTICGLAAGFMVHAIRALTAGLMVHTICGFSGGCYGTFAVSAAGFMVQAIRGFSGGFNGTRNLRFSRLAICYTQFAVLAAGLGYTQFAFLAAGFRVHAVCCFSGADFLWYT